MFNMKKSGNTYVQKQCLLTTQYLRAQITRCNFFVRILLKLVNQLWTIGNLKSFSAAFPVVEKKKKKVAVRKMLSNNDLLLTGLRLNSNKLFI